MKKSIKYAGIAAATLLTVAPIAAPVVSTVTTAQAAKAPAEGDSGTINYMNGTTVVGHEYVPAGTTGDYTLSNVPDGYVTSTKTVPVDSLSTDKPLEVNVTSTDTDATQVKNQVKDFKGQFGDIDSSTDIINALNNMGSTTSYFGQKNAGNIADVQKDDNVRTLMDSAKAADYNFAKLTDLHTKVYFTAKDASDKTYDGTTVGQRPSNIAAAMKLDKNMPMTITVHLNADDLTSVPESDQTFSFDINKTSDNELKSINAKFTTPISVAKNSKTAATQLVDTDSVVLNDQDGESTAVSDINFGTNYYSKYSDAMDAVKAANTAGSDINTVSGKEVTTPNIDGGEFKTAGTYYQTVTYTATSNSALAAFLDNYAGDSTVDSDYSIYVNGKKASAGYDYTAKNQKITFVRAINVSDNESEWTTTDTTGVVTTKTNHEFYTLKNDAGNDVTNRALAKNTAWKTNAVRTDQNGNKQYRVGASEWIDANDVTFSDKATDNNGEGAYTDVKALNGKVTTAGPEGFYYPLYDDNGKMVTNRGVAGLSAWYTDKSAVNANGDTVYHVATGEWLQGNNVTYTAY